MNPEHYYARGTQISISDRFNESLDNPKYYDFLSKYKILSFQSNSQYNFPIGNLPPSIQKIHFPYEYDLPLDNLPNSIKTIVLNSNNYSHKLDNLPNSINKLVLFGNFEDKLDNLPESITKLILVLNLKNKNPVPISNLPNSIIHLNIRIMNYPFVNIKVDVPDSVQNLEIESNIYNYLDKLPSDIKYLTFHSEMLEDIYDLPEGLEIIRFKGDFIGQFHNIPKSVKKIIFDKEYDFIDEYDLAYPNIIFSYHENIYGNNDYDEY